MARTTDTRFLVITHHPMTMSRMNRLFGVTMQEKGISQLRMPFQDRALSEPCHSTREIANTRFLEGHCSNDRIKSICNHITLLVVLSKCCK
ncbi:MAG: hypothetical protein ACLPPF_22110 [Rhodomicrobium sp.]